MNIKLVALIAGLAVASIGIIAGFGMTAATANNGEVEWELAEQVLRAEIGADTTFGPFGVEFEFDGDTWTVELQLPFGRAEKELDLSNGDDAKIELRFNEDGVPIEAEAEVKAFDVEGCGEISIEWKWQGGEYRTQVRTFFNEEGDPIKRQDSLEVNEVEIVEAEVCGLNLLGEVSDLDEANIGMRDTFEPAE
ncbi:MAG: hypothetical protein IH861_00655 [Chloroflexi bacterium]|nr:hypothetical protein [Chloroflexota bacterium]